jgi:nicotinamidase-related amidase
MMVSFELTASDSVLLVVDVQERFLAPIPAIGPEQECGRNCRILLTAAGMLNVPSVISEQYPKGLGATLPHVLSANPQARRFEKTHFSCGGDQALSDHFASLKRSHVVICGIEAHVCVLSTAADLLHQGHYVVVASDAVASRSERNRDHALAAMRDLGALAVPTEGIIFRWQRQAGVGCFKALSTLVK